MKHIKFYDIVPLIKDAFERGQTITIPVTGTSMAPTLDLDDAVTLAPAGRHDIVVGDILLYRRQNGQYVLHRAVALHDNTVDFCGDAQFSVEKGVSYDDILAQVVSYEKNGHIHDLTMLRREGRKRRRSKLFRRMVYAARRLSHNEPKNGIDPLRFVIEYLKMHIPAIVVLCLLSCVSAAAMLGMAMASGRVIDKALYDDLHNFTQWFVILIALLLLICGANMLYSNIRVRVIENMKNKIRQDLFATLLTKRYSSIQHIHSGEILNRMTSDVQIVVDGAATLVPQIVSLGTKLIGGIGFLMIVDPLFTVILVICAVIFSILLQIFSRVYRRLHKECQETDGKTRSYLQECIENLVVIKSFVNEKGVLAKLGSYQQNHFQKQVRRNLYASIGNTAVYSAFTFAYYAAMAWGVLRIAGVIGSGAPMLIGTFVTLLQVMEQIRSPFKSASGVVPQYYAMLASAERLQELRMLPKEEHLPLSCAPQNIYNEMTAIRLDQVTFAYTEKKPIFNRYSLTLHKGRLTVLTGPSGTGKTTLIKLLLGLISPQEGKISLTTSCGEIAVNAATRGLFAYVPQGNMILSGTIAENITFGIGEVSSEKVMEAARLACLEKTIASLPQGLHTVIGERGVGLSEGQIQRVAVARALLSGAPILLLDECTSALDIETEKRLIENLRTLPDRTILFISHRRAVLESADDVVAIDDR